MAKKNQAAEEMKEHLDPMEISRLHQMDDAAKMMDRNDKYGAIVKEDEDGNK